MIAISTTRRLLERSKQWAYPAPSSYIFGIGLNKTGTRSLAAALREVGLRALHRGDDATSEAVLRAIDEGLRPLDLIGDRFDAYLDVDAIVHGFREIDRAYPGSKYILTTCERDLWLESRVRHVEANARRASAREYRGCFRDVDESGWTAEWDEHHAAVAHYFADRPLDLLVLDIRAGEGWDKLAPFLDVRAPRQAFPRENVAGAGTYAPSATRARALRRLRTVKGLAVRRARRLIA